MNKEKRSSSSSSDHRFAFYHQNEALLFQFLLHECLRAHQILRKKPSKETFVQVVGKLDSSVDSWHAPSGHLPKLLHYWSLLSTHFDDQPSCICKTLGQTLNKAYLTAKKCYHVFQIDEKEHLKVYASLKKAIHTSMTLLFVKLYDFRDNASVLYFLLRHQEQFDALYREPIVKKTFRTFFPEGMKQAHFFLVEKFAKKGFHHLIPHIEQKLKKLDTQDNSRKTHGK